MPPRDQHTRSAFNASLKALRAQVSDLLCESQTGGVSAEEIESGLAKCHDLLTEARARMRAPGVTATDSRWRTLLTPRMRQLVQLIAEGRSNKEMAGLLKLSVKTIETHRTKLMSRIGAKNTAGIVVYALRSGLLNAGGT